MKIYRLLNMLILCSVFTSACKKELSLSAADFAVTTESVTLQLGDTARFSVSENPDILTFYSGEIGRRYAFKDRVEAEGRPLLNFRTSRANGLQENSLKLLLSNDFNGVAKGDTAITISNLASASWDDISDRATLASGGESNIASGDIDLSDYAAIGKPVFVAFKYQVAAGSIQDKWTVNSFLLKNNLADGSSYTIANMNTSSAPFTNYGVSSFSPGFAAYTLQNTYNWVVSSSQLVITGATAAGWATAPAEAWVFIGPINLRKVTPDTGIPIKGSAENFNGSIFNYQYQSKGTFDAVFTGGKVDVDQTTMVLKSIQMNIR